MKKLFVYSIILMACIWSFYKSFDNNSDTVFKEIKDKVVFVNDGEIYEKNEGKLVVVNGTMNSDNTFTFDDLDFKFHTPRIEMEVEELKDGEWVRSNKSKKEAVSAKVGDFKIKKDLVEKIADFPYYTKDIKNYTLNDEENWYVNEEGNIRLKFQYVELKKEYSVLGKQKGDTIEPYELKSSKTKLYRIFAKKITNQEELSIILKRSKNNNIIFTGLALVAVLFVGYNMFFKNEKD